MGVPWDWLVFVSNNHCDDEMGSIIFGCERCS